MATNRARQVFASAERREQLNAELELQTAQQVAETLGSMKGALMKLGQMASYIDEGLPEPIRETLASLQADAPPMSAALSAEVIEQELGRPPNGLFAEWDATPIAAASIGQVHRAMTRDGRAVAVKVQYPGVADAIEADLDSSDLLFRVIAMGFPNFEPGPLVEELRSRLTEELDYEQEARNQQLFADFYRGHPFIKIPEVLPELSSTRVLTTELASGARFADIAGWSQPERDLAGEAIFRFVFRSLYRMHAFNGDPHPGNYLFEPGGRVTFLDFGLVKRFTADEVGVFQEMIRTLVLQHDPSAFREVIEGAGLLTIGAPMTDAEVAEQMGQFYDMVAEDRPKTFSSAYASATVRHVFDTSSPLSRYATLPAQFVLIQRINMGLYAILGHLSATANWRRIGEELWPIVDGPASTPLGEQEAAWLAARTRG